MRIFAFILWKFIEFVCSNCLVADNMVIKISDFGMSRRLQAREYYRKGGEILLPVRWMAPECMDDGVFTVSGDIWSFGVLLWEIWTYASLPYAHLTNQEVYESVTQHNCLKQPELCPDAVYRLMKEVST